MQNSGMDFVVFDLNSSAGEGLGMLSGMDAPYPETAVVLMSLSSALRAIRHGAHGLLSRPFSPAGLAAVLERMAASETLPAPDRRPLPRELTPQEPGTIVGRCPDMIKLLRMLGKVAHGSYPALIVGEIGTGKNLVARSIHAKGPHSCQPFLSVDCRMPDACLLDEELFGFAGPGAGGISRPGEGLLVAAANGTVFLDEIGELSLELQAKLFLALQDKQVQPAGASRKVPIESRLLAASSRDLSLLVEQGRFRKDLYSRLNVVTLRLPPLRERRGDIGFLAAHFLDYLSQQSGASYELNDEALRMMDEYTWPGNVRELENAIRRGARMSAGAFPGSGDPSKQLIEYARQMHGTIQASGRPDVSN